MRERIELRGLVELIRDDVTRCIFGAVKNALLKRSVEPAICHRRGRGTHAVERVNHKWALHRADLEPIEVGGLGDGPLRVEHVAIAGIEPAEPFDTPLLEHREELRAERSAYHLAEMVRVAEQVR